MSDIDSILNYVVFLIPVAIVVTRLVNRARAKRAPPPPKKPPEPYIPVHFEVDDEDDTAYFRRRNAEDSTTVSKQAPARKTQKTIASPFTPKPELSSPISVRLPQPIVKSAGSIEKQNDFTFNLSHLSPLKQAVIMAEILGPPKGLAKE